MCLILVIILLLEVPFSIQNFTKIEEQGRIYKGKTAKPNSIPYQVALWCTNQITGRSFCGGSLITTKFVLTAAHCLYEMRLITVLLGAHSIEDMNMKTVKVNTTKFKGHEKFKYESVDYDIGLVELTSPVKLTKNIVTIKLPTKSYDKKSLIGQYGKLSGWGVTSDNENSPNNHLKELKVRLVSKKDCVGFEISHDSICGFGEFNGSACGGDSGGPLVLEKTNTQIGIVSYGDSKGCTKGHPHVYTEVWPYLNWIQQNSNYKVRK